MNFRYQKGILRGRVVEVVDTGGLDQLEFWARSVEMNSRVVARTVVGDAEISTVFLTIDHGFDDTPLWFETMIFGGTYDDCQWRYTTYDEAEAGHARVVKCLLNLQSPD